MSYAPPYSITDKSLAAVAGISRLLGEFSAKERLSQNPRLRRINRIKSIHSSLAIENNTLSLDEITAVLDGKRVLAPPKDIHEAKNAYDAYEHLSELDPYSVEDLLRAHGFMMGGLIHDAGRFRSGNVGVFAGDVLIHAGTPARYVPSVMADLFGWLRETEAHPLISSSVFHFEFEYIHPFSDGNGRTGRLWQSLILQRWDPLFAWTPIETLIAEHQQEYYAALASSQRAADATDFVEFMLATIEETLAGQMNEPVYGSVFEPVKPLGERHQEILLLLRSDPRATYDKLAAALGVSRSTVRRDLRLLEEAGRVSRIGSDKSGFWAVLGD